MAIPSNWTKGLRPVATRQVTAQEFAKAYAGKWVDINIYKDPALDLRPPSSEEEKLHNFGKAYVIGWYTPSTSDRQMVVCHVSSTEGFSWSDLPPETKKSIILETIIMEDVTIVALSPTILVAPEDAVDVRRRYPHLCTSCRNPAFLLYTSCECSSRDCRFFKE